MLILIATNKVFAIEKTLSWTAPATRIDGTKLELNEISGYDIEYNGKWFKFVKNTMEVVDVGPGKHCYKVRTVLVGGNVKSDYTPEQCVTIVSDAKPVIISDLVVK